MISTQFWRGKKILITGHTGFKGTWLGLWLFKLGAKVCGVSLPNEDRKFYSQSGLDNKIESRCVDVCSLSELNKIFKDFEPDIVIHMAAQSLVRMSYSQPVNTYSTNVMGTVNVLEASRLCDSSKAILIITTDKCYQNQEKNTGYVESDLLGGHDPYSNSKACAEMVVDCYRQSYFSGRDNNKMLASARAGNVIGGGDWAIDRIVPDVVRAIISRQRIKLRNPSAVRPWQHVLEPLAGYLMVCQKLYQKNESFAGPWNFGPSNQSIIPVEQLVKTALSIWPDNLGYEAEVDIEAPVETKILSLDSTKARTILDWEPKLDFEETVQWTIDWYQQIYNGSDYEELTMSQIELYMKKCGVA